MGHLRTSSKSTKWPRLHTRGPRRRGQALAEFALILPVFLLVTLGLVDFARGFTAFIAVSNGVREAALYASQYVTTVNYCPEGAAECASDPDWFYHNRVWAETDAAGLDRAALSISAPECTTAASLAGTPTWGACTSGSNPTFVRASAAYSLSLVIPAFDIGVVSFPGTFDLSATTTAATVLSPDPKPFPTQQPPITPSPSPTLEPTPSASPDATVPASEAPSESPSAEPSASPSAEPTASPTAEPTASPTAEPTAAPTAEPTATPTEPPTAEPSPGEETPQP